jgi:hypothetical protein
MLLLAYDIALVVEISTWRKAMTKQQHGYHHLETDDEVLKRLKEESALSRMRSRCIDETFDQ